MRNGAAYLACLQCVYSPISGSCKYRNASHATRVAGIDLCITAWHVRVSSICIVLFIAMIVERMFNVEYKIFIFILRTRQSFVRVPCSKILAPRHAQYVHAKKSSSSHPLCYCTLLENDIPLSSISFRASFCLV
jgi:hypothetical protein